MRQMASGFAIGSLSIGLLFVPFFMVLLNSAPDYTTAVARVFEESGVLTPVHQASAQIAEYRQQLMAPMVDSINRHLFPRIP